jgi:hypothetical protein
MDGEPAPVSSQRLLTLADNMRDKRYRDSYVATHTRHILARQMRNFRGERSQAEFGELIGKRQTVVSRLENPNYGAWQLRTMLEIAGQLNIAVFARFVDFPTFLKYSNDLSDAALHPKEYDEQAIRRLVSVGQRGDISPRTVLDIPAFEPEPRRTLIMDKRERDTPVVIEAGTHASPRARLVASNSSNRSYEITRRHRDPIALVKMVA